MPNSISYKTHSRNIVLKALRPIFVFSLFFEHFIPGEKRGKIVLLESQFTMCHNKTNNTRSCSLSLHHATRTLNDTTRSSSNIHRGRSLFALFDKY